MTRLRSLAELVHQGLKGLEYPHDVWLRGEVMDAFVAWRDCLGEQERLHAGQISSRLVGSVGVSSERIASWRLDSRGYQS